MRYLAVDYGQKRIGLAISDEGETFASPLDVIEAGQGIISKLKEIIDNEGAKAVIVGLPLNMDGSVGKQAETVFEFAEELKGVVDIPVYFQDERLSSFSAEDLLKSSGLSRKKKKGRVDAIAATEILKAFLEKKKFG